MKADDEKRDQEFLSLPGASSADLMGRQSVRATFKLASGCIDAISIVATQLGIKQKSLFDHLVEDTEALKLIAREVRHKAREGRERVQKTYVMSRRTLVSLDTISQRFNTPRDILVEYSVQRLLPIIIKEQAKHDIRKKLFAEIEQHYKAGEKIFKEISRRLGPDDPLSDRFEAMLTVYSSVFQQMTSFIERGKIIEAFDSEDLRRMMQSRKG